MRVENRMNFGVYWGLMAFSCAGLFFLMFGASFFFFSATASFTGEALYNIGLGGMAIYCIEGSIGSLIAWISYIAAEGLLFHDEKHEPSYKREVIIRACSVFLGWCAGTGYAIYSFLL